jgi:hypothetical protein
MNCVGKSQIEPELKQTNWKTVAELVGIAAIVASLVFLGLQIKQTDAVASTEIFIAYQEARKSYERLIIENADVWRRACIGEELTPSEQLIASQIFEAFLNTNYVGWQAARIGVANTSVDERIYAFAANLHRYPGFLEIDMSHRNWAKLGTALSTDDTDEWASAILERYEALRDLEPNPDSDPRWCGHL